MKQSGFTVRELLASARSGGGRVPGASRVLLARQQRRTPHPFLPMRCLATSTLGEQDNAKIGSDGDLSNESDTYEPCAGGKLLMGAAQNAG